MTRAREISNVLGRNIESTTFTATAGQTAFSITHAAGRIQVYMNGLLLDPTEDWTSDGSTVTLTEGAVAGDELEVVKFDNLAVADAIPRTGHTGTIDFSSATFTPPAGHVIQVVQDYKTDTASYNGVDTYHTVMSLNITPSSTSSKILISADVSYGFQADQYEFVFKLQRSINGGSYNSVGIGDADGARERGWFQPSGGGHQVQMAHGTLSNTFLDTPSTTSQINYRLLLRSHSYTFHINRSHTDNNGAGYSKRLASNLTAMEIAG